MPKKKQDVAVLPETEKESLQRKIADFVASNEPEISFPGLSNSHRKYIHLYVAKIGYRTFSTGNKSNRVLHVKRIWRKSPTLGHSYKLDLSPARQLLAEMVPTIRECLANAKQHRNGETTGQEKIDRDAMLLSLGPRVIPPRSNRISNELFREKQDLPIYHYQDEILRLLKKYPIFIISGETGSGKTTQVPQYILNDGCRRNRPCRIIVSQPRRVAAISVAQRVAEERGELIGDTVGYQIRMESRCRKSTSLIYTTSGCLMRSIMFDPQDPFRKITHLIIDEIHERDKYTDFTLITIKEQIKRNKNIKVILMSATMDIGLLSHYFGDCPVLHVPGQCYDVRLFHLEDILYHTGYRTALMDKYLNAMIPQQNNYMMPAINGTTNGVTAERLQDEYMKTMLDNLLDKCCDLLKTEEELSEYFDQIQYYIESEGMPVDAGHSLNGTTPLIAACRTNCRKYVQYFLQRQANVEIRDINGCTAKDYAAFFEDGFCLRLLESSTSIQQQYLMTQEDAEKQRILNAYQQQFNDESEIDHDLLLSLLEGLYRSSHPGAIMVFLPGYNDIVQQRDLLNSTLPSGTFRICILHGQMDSQDQTEALRPQRVRKIILSTNIGQTSITIPDLAYIIDSGKVKLKTYDAITESSQLQSVWISQADANQRSGRAGRTQNGICYRLYSRTKYNFMPKFCIPEFMRIALTEICLFAKTLDANCDVQTYLARSLSPPSTISVQNAIKKLKILQVFNENESVTELGKRLVEIPLDVQLGKCLLYSLFFKCFDTVLTIVAFHSVKDPFILPSDRSAQGQASFQRKSFAGQSFSDQKGILEMYKSYMAARNKNRARVREFCNKHYLSYTAMETFIATRRQIADIISHKYPMNDKSNIFNDDWNIVRFCLAGGFYPNVAVIDREKNTLISGAEKQLMIQRISALNPPGMKNLKEFIKQLPYDWIIFYEKSRVGKSCAINMNTIVNPLLIILHCGRDCEIEEEAISDESDDDETDEDVDVDILTKDLCKLSTAQSTNVDIHLQADVLLDNWIKFKTSVVDGRMIMLLREFVQQEFKMFLYTSCSDPISPAVHLIHRLLATLDKEKKSEAVLK